MNLEESMKRYYNGEKFDVKLEAINLRNEPQTLEEVKRLAPMNETVNKLLIDYYKKKLKK